MQLTCCEVHPIAIIQDPVLHNDILSAPSTRRLLYNNTAFLSFPSCYCAHQMTAQYQSGDDSSNLNPRSPGIGSCRSEAVHRVLSRMTQFLSNKTQQKEFSGKIEALLNPEEKREYSLSNACYYTRSLHRRNDNFYQAHSFIVIFSVFSFFFFFFVFSNTILRRMFLKSFLKLSFIICSLFINVLFIVFQSWDSAIPLVRVVLQDITHNKNNQDRLKRKLMSESMPTSQFPMTRIETTNQANLIKNANKWSVPQTLSIMSIDYWLICSNFCLLRNKNVMYIYFFLSNDMFSERTGNISCEI